MAHFNLENIMSDATRLDAPIQRGPLMRWQRKAMESGVRNLSVSDCKCERSDGSINSQSCQCSSHL